MTAPRDDDEWRKKITAALLSGMTIIFFDNVEDILSSAQLAAALTAPEWSDRLLGASEIVHAPNRATWMATGNNLRVGGDLARRCYWIRLDARMARPWQREAFAIADLRTYASEHRGELLAALLTLGRYWFAAGCLGTRVPALGGYESWARIVGGVLAAAEVPGFLANLEELYEQVDDDEVAWEIFLEAWASALGERSLPVASVVEAVRKEKSELAAALPLDLADALTRDGKGNVSFAMRLGHALRKRQGAIFGRYRLERAGENTTTNTAAWRVRRVPESEFPGSPGFSGPTASSASSSSPNHVESEGRPEEPGKPGNPDDDEEAVA